MISPKVINVRTANSGDDYLGIKLGEKENEVTQIIVPKYYMSDFEKSVDDISKDEKIALRDLVKAWKKYQYRVKTRNNGESQGAGINFDFDVSIQLIQDFLEFGLYIEFERNEALSNCGKIDFPRTIKKCIPTMLEEGPLYLPYITRVKKMADEDLVRDIQILVLNDISKKIGWLVGFNVRLQQSGVSNSIGKAAVNFGQPRLFL